MAKQKYEIGGKYKYPLIGTKVIDKHSGSVVRIDGYKMVFDNMGYGNGYDVIYSPINNRETKITSAVWIAKNEQVEMTDAEFYKQRSKNTGII